MLQHFCFAGKLPQLMFTLKPRLHLSKKKSPCVDATESACACKEEYMSLAYARVRWQAAEVCLADMHTHVLAGACERARHGRCVRSTHVCSHPTSGKAVKYSGIRKDPDLTGPPPWACDSIHQQLNPPGTCAAVGYYKRPFDCVSVGSWCAEPSCITAKAVYNPKEAV